MIVNDPNGNPLEFPDTMSLDEVKAVMRKKFPPKANPNAGAESVVAGMGPVEGAVTAFGEAARHALRKAANFSLPHTFAALGNRDEDVEAARQLNAPLMRKHPVAGTLGELSIAVPAGMIGPGKARAVTGLFPRAMKLIGAGVEGGVQGATFANPEDRQRDAAVGSVIGPIFEGAGQLARGLMDAAGPYANQAALKTVRPGGEITEEIADNYYKRGGLLTDAFEAVGKRVREVGAHKPMLFNAMARRHQIGTKFADTVNPKLKAVVDTLDSKGATVDTAGLVNDLKAVRDQMYLRPGTKNLTDPMRQGLKEAEDLILEVQTHPGLQPGASLSQFEDAKRILQKSGFLTSSGKYLNPKAVSADPSAEFTRKAARLFREYAEKGAEAVDPDLAAQFKALKKDSQIAGWIEEATKGATIGDFSSASSGPMGTTRAMPNTVLPRMGTNLIMEHARPILGAGAGATEFMGKITPRDASDFWRAAVIEAMRNRSKERRDAPR